MATTQCKPVRSIEISGAGIPLSIFYELELNS